MGSLVIFILVIVGLLSAISAIFGFGYRRGVEGKRSAIIAAEKKAVEYIQKRESEVDQKIDRHLNGLEMIISSTSQQYPWLAALYADFAFAIDQNKSDQLANKSHPAIKASESVALIAREKRELLYQLKRLEYQIQCYETYFPWLEEFKEIPPAEAFSMISVNENSEDSAVTNHLLSPEEYSKLPDVEKYQRALDRYCSRKKTSWDVGIEYERFVGYLYEQDGYKVKYHGATEGLMDLGRDLISIKNDVVLIIQCKRWSQDKTIHEKHVFQLYGSLVSWLIENPDRKAIGAFYSTTQLSEEALKFSRYLGIEVHIKPYEEYPLIKCNVSRSGEKIYHLPFDQQYDRLNLTPDVGDRYVKTVREAEALGFRRAYRWSGNK